MNPKYDQDREDFERRVLAEKVSQPDFKLSLSPVEAGADNDDQHQLRCEIYFTEVFKRICLEDAITEDMRDTLYEYGLQRVPDLSLLAVRTGISPHQIQRWISEVPEFQEFWGELTLMAKAWWTGKLQVLAFKGDRFASKQIVDIVNKSVPVQHPAALEGADPETKAEDLIKKASKASPRQRGSSSGKKRKASSGKKKGRRTSGK